MSVSQPTTVPSEQHGRPWRPGALIQASIALHVGAAGLLLLRPHAWPWALGALAADHLALTAAGLIPRSRLLGPNLIRLPAGAASVAITIDDGPDPEVTPAVLDILDRHGARATFFCLGERVMRHAALARDIAARGHEIGNHSYRHLKRFSVLGPAGVADEVLRAQQAIRAATGVRARYFRAPAGLRNAFLEPVLARCGLKLVSWTRRGFDTVNGNPADVLARLTGGIRDGDILLLHDAHAARAANGAPVVVEVLPRLLEILAGRGLTPVTLTQALAPRAHAGAA